MFKKTSFTKKTNFLENFLSCLFVSLSSVGRNYFPSGTCATCGRTQGEQDMLLKIMIAQMLKNTCLLRWQLYKIVKHNLLLNNDNSKKVEQDLLFEVTNVFQMFSSIHPCCKKVGSVQGAPPQKWVIKVEFVSNLEDWDQFK